MLLCQAIASLYNTEKFKNHTEAFIIRRVESIGNLFVLLPYLIVSGIDKKREARLKYNNTR